MSSSRITNLTGKQRKKLIASAIWKAFENLKSNHHSCISDLDLWGEVSSQINEDFVEVKTLKHQNVHDRFSTYPKDKTLLGCGFHAESFSEAESTKYDHSDDYIILDDIDDPQENDSEIKSKDGTVKSKGKHKQLADDEAVVSANNEQSGIQKAGKFLQAENDGGKYLTKKKSVIKLEDVVDVEKKQQEHLSSDKFTSGGTTKCLVSPGEVVKSKSVTDNVDVPSLENGQQITLDTECLPKLMTNGSKQIDTVEQVEEKSKLFPEEIKLGKESKVCGGDGFQGRNELCNTVKSVEFPVISRVSKPQFPSVVFTEAGTVLKPGDLSISTVKRTKLVGNTQSNTDLQHGFKAGTDSSNQGIVNGQNDIQITDTNMCGQSESPACDDQVEPMDLRIASVKKSSDNYCAGTVIQSDANSIQSSQDVMPVEFDDGFDPQKHNESWVADLESFARGSLRSTFYPSIKPLNPDHQGESIKTPHKLPQSDINQNILSAVDAMPPPSQSKRGLEFSTSTPDVPQRKRRKTISDEDVYHADTETFCIDLFDSDEDWIESDSEFMKPLPVTDSISEENRAPDEVMEAVIPHKIVGVSGLSTLQNAYNTDSSAHSTSDTMNLTTNTTCDMDELVVPLNSTYKDTADLTTAKPIPSLSTGLECENKHETSSSDLIYGQAETAQLQKPDGRSIPISGVHSLNLSNIPLSSSTSLPQKQVPSLQDSSQSEKVVNPIVPIPTDYPVPGTKAKAIDTQYLSNLMSADIICISTDYSSSISDSEESEAQIVTDSEDTKAPIEIVSDDSKPQNVIDSENSKPQESKPTIETDSNIICAKLVTYSENAKALILTGSEEAKNSNDFHSPVVTDPEANALVVSDTEVKAPVVTRSALSLCTMYGSEDDTSRTSMALDGEEVEESIEELSDIRLKLLKELEDLVDSGSNMEEDADSCHQLEDFEMQSAGSSQASDAESEPDSGEAETQETGSGVEEASLDVLERLRDEVDNGSQESESSPAEVKTSLSFWCDGRVEQPIDFGQLYPAADDSTDLRKVLDSIQAGKEPEQSRSFERKVVVIPRQEQRDVDWRLAGKSPQEDSRKVTTQGPDTRLLIQAGYQSNSPRPTNMEELSAASEAELDEISSTRSVCLDIADGRLMQQVIQRPTTPIMTINIKQEPSDHANTQSPSSPAIVDMKDKKVVSHYGNSSSSSATEISQPKKPPKPMEISCSLDPYYVMNTEQVGENFFEVNLEGMCELQVGKEEEEQADKYCSDLILRKLSLASAICEKKQFLKSDTAKQQFDTIQNTVYEMEVEAEYLTMLIFLVKSNGSVLVEGLPYPVTMLCHGDFRWLKRVFLQDETVHSLPQLEDLVFLCSSKDSLNHDNLTDTKAHNKLVVRRRTILRNMLTRRVMSIEDIEQHLAKLKVYRHMATVPCSKWTCVGTGHPYFLRAKIQSTHKNIRWMLQLQEKDAKERTKTKTRWNPPKDETTSSDAESTTSVMSTATGVSRCSSLRQPSPETQPAKRRKSNDVEISEAGSEAGSVVCGDRRRSRSPLHRPSSLPVRRWRGHYHGTCSSPHRAASSSSSDHSSIRNVSGQDRHSRPVTRSPLYLSSSRYSRLKSPPSRSGSDAATRSKLTSGNRSEKTSDPPPRSGSGAATRSKSTSGSRSEKTSDPPPRSGSGAATRSKSRSRSEKTSEKSTSGKRTDAAQNKSTSSKRKTTTTTRSDRSLSSQRSTSQGRSRSGSIGRSLSRTRAEKPTLNCTIKIEGVKKSQSLTKTTAVKIERGATDSERTSSSRSLAVTEKKIKVEKDTDYSRSRFDTSNIKQEKRDVKTEKIMPMKFSVDRLCDMRDSNRLPWTNSSDWLSQYEDERSLVSNSLAHDDHVSSTSTQASQRGRIGIELQRLSQAETRSQPSFCQLCSHNSGSYFNYVEHFQGETHGRIYLEKMLEMGPLRFKEKFPGVLCRKVDKIPFGKQKRSKPGDERNLTGGTLRIADLRCSEAETDSTLYNPDSPTQSSDDPHTTDTIHTPLTQSANLAAIGPESPSLASTTDDEARTASDEEIMPVSVSCPAPQDLTVISSTATVSSPPPPGCSRTQIYDLSPGCPTPPGCAPPSEYKPLPGYSSTVRVNPSPECPPPPGCTPPPDSILPPGSRQTTTPPLGYSPHLDNHPPTAYSTPTPVMYGAPQYPPQMSPVYTMLRPRYQNPWYPSPQPLMYNPPSVRPYTPYLLPYPAPCPAPYPAPYLMSQRCMYEGAVYGGHQTSHVTSMYQCTSLIQNSATLPSSPGEALHKYPWLRAFDPNMPGENN